MEPLTASKSPAKKDYSACSGCSLCLLPCPVWRQKRDITYSWQGRARALQQGATTEELSDSILACTYCGSCDPICPEGIDLRGTMAKLRGNHEGNPFVQEIKKRIDEALETSFEPQSAARLFIAGESPGNEEKILYQLSQKGSIETTHDNGQDIALALEAGMEIPQERLDRFVGSLKGAREIIVSEGILKRPLKQLLPGIKVKSLGEALSALPEIRKAINKSDFYIIESRAYNSDLEKMVGYYDKLRRETGATFNLDLNRIVTPTTATSIQNVLGVEGINVEEQIKWLLEGREVKRIVVENEKDGEAFRTSTDVIVIDLIDLI